MNARYVSKRVQVPNLLQEGMVVSESAVQNRKAIFRAPNKHRAVEVLRYPRRKWRNLRYQRVRTTTSDNNDRYILVQSKTQKDTGDGD